MNDIIYLTKMTQEIAEAYFQHFVIDPALFLDGQQIRKFVYSEEWLEAYLERNKDNVHLAIMIQNNPIGEILFKRIDHANGTAVLSIHLQNDSVKGKGYGTCAETLAIEYAFNELKLNVLYADAIKNNPRSMHVLEKVGFQLVNEDEQFMYYKIENLQSHQ